MNDGPKVKVGPIPADFDEQQVACFALVKAAAEMSKSLDAFASWAAGGFAAALALFIANSDAHRWMGQQGFITAGRLFAAVLVITTIQKYFSIIIGGIAVAHAAGDEAVMRQIERRGNSLRFDANQYSALVVSTVWRLPKRFLIWQLSRKSASIYMQPARNAAWLLQAQAVLVLVDAGTLLWSACSIAWQ